MAFQQPFGDRRPHPGLFEQSAYPLLFTDLSYNNTGYAPFSFSLPSYSLQVVSSPHGFSSGFEPSYEPLVEQSPRKRRRVGNQDTNVSQSHATSDRGPKPHPCPLHEKHDTGKNPASPHCVESTMSPTSPIARSVFGGLSRLLCPCCDGFGWNPSGGHQRLHDTSPTTVYNPSEPYMTEKSPSMQLPSQPSGPPRLESNITAGLHYEESSPLREHSASRLPPRPGAIKRDSDDVYGSNNISPMSESTQLVKPESYISNYGATTQVSPKQDSESPVHEPRMIGPPVPCSLQSSRQAGSFGVGQFRVQAARHETGVNSQPESWTAAFSESDSQRYFDILTPHQRGGKRGPFKDLNLREQTAQTRRMGSCIRCRMQRIRCDMNPDDRDGDCLTCKKVANTRAGRFPCLRYKITDISLCKPGQVPGYEWTRRWHNSISDPIKAWASNEIKVIHLSEGYSNRRIALEVREFVPQPGDKLERTWDHNGVKKSARIPPYALVNLDAGVKIYLQYICDSMVDTFPAILSQKNSLLYFTYVQTWRLCRDRCVNDDLLELLKLTFQLWMTIRLSTTSAFIVGEERLGMSENILEESPHAGKIPVPPVLGAQTDLILIHHIQTKLRREVLDRLQKLTLKNSKENWLVTYLVTFIFLHNASMIIAHDAGYARKHGMPRRFAREDKVEEYFVGANVLLAHFHYCNKGVYPFSEACSDKDLRTLAALDNDQIKFIHATKQYSRLNKDYWRNLHHGKAYENEYYFVSQLFEENWQPRKMT